MSYFSSAAEGWTFFSSIVMGVTMVMGVSAVSSAPSFMLNYYKYVQGDENVEPKHKKYWETVLTFYTVVTMVTQTIFEPLNLTTFCCRLSLRFRILGSCTLMLVELLVILLLPTSSYISENGAIIALMFMAFIGGFARAFYENTGYALFGPCPPMMISGFVIGAAVSGALTSLLQIIIKASMAEDYESVKKQSYIYFSTAIAIIIITMIMVEALSRLKYAKKFVAEFRSKRGFFANIYRKRLPPVNSNESLEDETDGDAIKKNEEREISPIQGDYTKEDSEGLTTAELLQSVKVWPIIKKIYPMQFSCFFTYFTTYLLFPGVMLAVDPDDDWYGTIVVAVFGAGDLLGRLFCLIRCFWPPRKWVIIGTISRILLFPLLLLCATGHIPTFGAAYAVSTITGFTNGYFATISVTYAPESEGLNSDGEKAIAGQATGACLLFGVSTGSLLQLAIALKL